MDLTDSSARVLLDVARTTICQALGGPAQPPVDASQFTEPAGCFVTLHRRADGALRGCIGQLEATEPLNRAVEMAARSVLEDPRFRDAPVTLEELPQLDIELTVLSPLRLRQNALDFDPATEGIYLVFGRRAGCFLPQVARETGWNREQLLDRLCVEKLGLSPLIWRNPHAKLSTFTVQILGPEPSVKGPAPMENRAFDA